MIEPENIIWNSKQSIDLIRKYLPAQAPLKDFVHHNTLHAFQNYSFFEACKTASDFFGYKCTLSIEEYRVLYEQHKIKEEILEDRIIKNVGRENADDWIYKLFHSKYNLNLNGQLFKLRSKWKSEFNLDIDAEVQLKLFKLVAAYLDQGIAQWNANNVTNGLLLYIQELETKSYVSQFRTKEVRELLFNKNLSVRLLLDKMIGDEKYYTNYLFDQQFSHSGWSGLVASIERNPNSLLYPKNLNLEEYILINLLFELDALYSILGSNFEPLCKKINFEPVNFVDKAELDEHYQALAIWQEAWEWTYYDQVLSGIYKKKKSEKPHVKKKFQALFCIDDREGSLRRHLEGLNEEIETFGTAGHFGVEFYYQPENSLHYTKVCPPPVTPKYLIKEKNNKYLFENEIHFSEKSNGFANGFFYSIFLGFYSFIKLFLNIFKPSLIAGASFSFAHMGKESELEIEAKSNSNNIDGLQCGFTISEMFERVEAVLKGIGLVEEFGNIVYVIGHGASSINNTHYAGYDCGACSGRPGSVNARVFSFMANHPEVRTKLNEIGIFIPNKTQFIGALHDTTRDEIEFYDTHKLSEINLSEHQNNVKYFNQALDFNAKERSRRFFSINTKQEAKVIHDLIRDRSVSLFEPRPELNHATNCLCIVGRRMLHEGLFLDRRAFFNSYDYQYDPGGKFLFKILSAVTPVCGGINLEYYFSRTDNEKLGAGSKLSHNVVGLIGVCNGYEGDLRPGLPYQMVDIHDPLRLLMIIEHYPNVILKTLQSDAKVYEWYDNNWINLVIIHPVSGEMQYFSKGNFYDYVTHKKLLDTADNINNLIESTDQNIPVYLINKKDE